jgi:hypothetical protein
VKGEFSMHITTSNREVMLVGFGNYPCNRGSQISRSNETEKERNKIIPDFLKLGYCDVDIQHCYQIKRSVPEFFHHPDKWLSENAPQYLTPENKLNE